MEELKTLKDLEVVCAEFRIRPLDGYIPGKTGIVNISSLKQEAIKWIKELRNTRGDLGGSYEGGMFDGKMDWIEEFFDLTEEDLK